ncbi:MAG TPA: cobalamin-dependent protein [Thermoanaerobaculia bacterium]|nr:cobalamin-dependent protein [Thermoanaerobaculia bacterium]
MSRVILVNPKMCSPRSVRLPLSLLALGAVLEGRYDYRIVDGNLDPQAVATVLGLLAEEPGALLAVTVMPGPQVATAIEISAAVRLAHPEVPIAWGGYFPTLYPDAALNAPYVDYVVRGQGEDTLLQLLERLPEAGPPLDVGNSAAAPGGLAEIGSLSYKAEGTVVHNPERHFSSPDDYPPLPYERAGEVARYLRPSFLGRRTAVHQAALGCRYHCTFCGVVSMWNGATRLQGAARLERALLTLRDGHGADAIQFYDHNFFDTEESSLPTLEVLARLQLPWWSYARADTLAKFSPETWKLLEQSRYRMSYIGAEAASDEVLKRMKKGSRVEHTFEVARKTREHGIIPEFSFVLGGPEDPEGEVEKTLGFIQQIKAVHPACEVILYFYSPTPQRDPRTLAASGAAGTRLPVLKTYGPDGPELPTTPEEWTEPRWIAYVCHQDAPWLTPRIKARVRDFGKVLACRFPTAQDWSTPAWGKEILRLLAGWRYKTGRYGHPWELDLARRVIPLREPARESL